MLKNYLLIAWRQMRKQKMYSVIKIGGLALGIATCLLIALYIRNELSFDKHYPDGERMYRVLALYNDKGTVFKGTSFPAPFAKALKDEFPQVEMVTRSMPHALFAGAGSNEMKIQGQQENVYEEGFTFADPDFLPMFGLKMAYGDVKHALDAVNSIAISRSKAEKYFPHTDPVGKVIYLNDDMSKPHTIGGVFEDMPANLHLHYDFLLSLNGTEMWKGEGQFWGAQNYDTYIKLKAGTDPVAFGKNINLIKQKYFVPRWEEQGLKDVNKIANNLNFALQPVRAIHISSEIRDSLQHGDEKFVWLFGAIALFILLLACINFVNLATARSANRAKEVGLRKVVGSGRLDLVRQFLTESMLFSLISFVLALGLAWLLLPFLNRVAGTSIRFPWTEWWLAPVVIGSAMVVGLLAGLYPSFYLSAFQPIRVLKGEVSRGSRNSRLQSVLVVFQFTTSIILIFASLVVYRQMHFILNRKLGFEKDQVVLIRGANTLKENLKPFKEELVRVSGVQAATASSFLPVTGGQRNMNTFYRDGKQQEEEGTGSQIWRVDADYIKAMGVVMLQGRNFSPDIKSDSQAVVINEAFVKKMGLKQPLGQVFGNGNQKFTVIGVMQNFNFESMHEEIGPLCLVLGRYANTVSVKVSPGHMQETMAQIKNVWAKFSPHQAIRYEFLDERFARMYMDVQRTGRIFGSLTVLALVIACLGLFALSAFMAEQRGKEISIRKVLGASVDQLLALLSRDFVKLVLIAIVIASPVAWWMMHTWLQDFVYRVSLSWWMVALAGLAVLVIALATISFQAVRAAVANPVKRLRSE